MGVVAWILIGLIAGLVGRAVVRPHRRLGCLGTIAVGLVGSLIGGTLGNVLSGNGADIAAAGLLGSIFGSILLLALTRLAASP